MDRDDIIAALTAIGERLDDQGLQGDMYVVGGAAIAFAARRSTRDIDAVFEPKMAIYDAAALVGSELGLPLGWLNDAVKGFLVGDDALAAPVLDVPGLRCMIASPQMLLALKVAAHRVGEDEDDVLAPRRASRPEHSPGGAGGGGGQNRGPAGSCDTLLRGGALRRRMRVSSPPPNEQHLVGGRVSLRVFVIRREASTPSDHCRGEGRPRHVVPDPLHH